MRLDVAPKAEAQLEIQKTFANIYKVSRFKLVYLRNGMFQAQEWHFFIFAQV